MPRGKVIKRSLDEQIRILEEDIRIAQNKLNKLQAKWKELQKQKREEDMADLYSLIKETGMSVEQLRQVLTSTPPHIISPEASDQDMDSDHTQSDAIDIA